MRCPFLREAQVKQCQASAYRKLIIRGAGDGTGERCSSPEYVDCPAAKQLHEDHPSSTHCPFLHESLVQYCSAAPVPKFVPYNESAGSRCATENHRYCEEYLALASPGSSVPPNEASRGVDDGIDVPRHLQYSPNHLWLDIAEDGACHIGIDAFLARTLGSVEEVTFAFHPGMGRPSAVLKVNGVDFPMMFPNELVLGSANVRLRSKPEHVVSSPYTLGWLFEGATNGADDAAVTSVRHGLLSGVNAVAWMTRELQRLTEFVHRKLAASQPGEASVMNDGGFPVLGVARMMDREGLLGLYNEFFSPYTTWRSV